MGLRSEEVGRQEEEPGAAFGDGLFDCRALVGSEVVGDDDIAWPQDGGELGPHIEFEDLAVHRPVDDERRHQAIVTQAGDEGFDLPMSEGHGGLEPLAFRRPAKEPGHLGAVAVSSRKTRRWGARRMAGCRVLIHLSRRRRTSARSCSAATRASFKGQALCRQEAADIRRVHPDAAPLEFGRQFRQRDVRDFLDPPQQIVAMRSQLAAPVPALLARRQLPGRQVLGHVADRRTHPTPNTFAA